MSAEIPKEADTPNYFAAEAITVCIIPYSSDGNILFYYISKKTEPLDARALWIAIVSGLKD